MLFFSPIAIQQKTAKNIQSGDSVVNLTIANLFQHPGLILKNLKVLYILSL